MPNQILPKMIRINLFKLGQELDFILITDTMNSNNSSSKCQKCQLFFANEAFNGFCSKCYKEKEVCIEKKHQDNKTCASIQDRQIADQFAGLSLNKQENIEQKDKKRCFNCNKKTGLLGVQCKCGYIFCNSHRMPENHECAFDHKAALNKQLKIKLNKVDHGKILQI